MRTLTLLILIVIASFGACKKDLPPEPPAGDKPPVARAESESPTTVPATQPESRTEWGPVGEAELDVVQKAQLEKATAAQQALGKTLLGALTQSIGERGFADSVEFCRGAAPDIAKKVGEEYGVSIGRTSHKLRNPTNEAPGWAVATVAAKADGRRFFAGPNGKFGVLAPIKTAELCVNCHGATETIAEGVPAALAEKYPQDQATGFAVDELRGWFWVEVPGPS